jgi:hypothetical protein
MDNATSPQGDGACVRRSRALPFTQAGLKRAIAAAQAAGLHVTAIRPDGTIELGSHPQAHNEPMAGPEPEIVL